MHLVASSFTQVVKPHTRTGLPARGAVSTVDAAELLEGEQAVFALKHLHAPWLTYDVGRWHQSNCCRLHLGDPVSCCYFADVGRVINDLPLPH